MEKAVKEKNVKLKGKRDFYDKTNSLKKRTVGEEMNVNPDRAEKLISLGLVEKPDADAPEATAEK